MLVRVHPPSIQLLGRVHPPTLQFLDRVHPPVLRLPERLHPPPSWRGRLVRAYRDEEKRGRENGEEHHLLPIVATMLSSPRATAAIDSRLSDGEKINSFAVFMRILEHSWAMPRGHL